MVANIQVVTPRFDDEAPTLEGLSSSFQSRGPYQKFRVETANFMMQSGLNGGSNNSRSTLTNQQLLGVSSALDWVERQGMRVDLATNRVAPWTLKAENGLVAAEHRLEQVIDGLGLSPEAQAQVRTLETQALTSGTTNVAPSNRAWTHLPKPSSP